MVLGLVAEVDGAVSCLHVTGDLGNREIDVPERYCGHADKPIAVSTGPVRHPIVEGRGSSRPHVGWFGYMGIDVNDIEAFEEICGAHDYKNRTTAAANAISAEITPKGTRVRLANSPTGPCFPWRGTGMKFPSLKHPALRPDDL